MIAQSQNALVQLDMLHGSKGKGAAKYAATAEWLLRPSARGLASRWMLHGLRFLRPSAHALLLCRVTQVLPLRSNLSSNEWPFSSFPEYPTVSMTSTMGLRQHSRQLRQTGRNIAAPNCMKRLLLIRQAAAYSLIFKHTWTENPQQTER